MELNYINYMIWLNTNGIIGIVILRHVILSYIFPALLFQYNDLNILKIKLRSAFRLITLSYHHMQG